MVGVLAVAGPDPRDDALGAFGVDRLPGQKADPRIVRIVEGQGRPATPAEAPPRHVRASQPGDLAPRDAERGLGHGADHREGAAHGLLAHPAMAEMVILGRAAEGETDRAALAACGPGVGHGGFRRG